ncbi:MAG: hypothetical protein FJY95_00730 [Candidatus Handelsmanbacteria bacterium]|nr:hypothetical protein [Candidatus Handelsmanbacteria bacterium]
MLPATYDCPPTLSDQQILDFCRDGYLVLPGVVPEEINRRTVAFLEEHNGPQPDPILGEEWFTEAVLKNPAAAGAVRSLLGAHFRLPGMMANHRTHCPQPAQKWHRDGGSIYNRRLDYLQVFYYPSDTPEGMGPTEVVPGSHFVRSKSNYMRHYDCIRHGVRTAAPAGSIFLTIYSIWHRRGKSTGEGVRNLLKYNYWRTTPPRRDWLADLAFNFSWIHLSSGRPTFEQFMDGIGAAELFTWLCGLEQEYHFQGGQCWPVSAINRAPYTQEGLPVGLWPHPL